MSSTPWHDRHQILSELEKRLHLHRVLSLPNDHPLWIAIRTYSLSLSLSLGPALVPLLTSRKSKTVLFARVLRILRKELSVRGFAFAMTVAVGGGATLDHLWCWLEDEDRQPSANKSMEELLLRIKAYLRDAKTSPFQRSILLNCVSSLLAILLMHSRRRTPYVPKADIPLTVALSPPKDKKTSATLDLTLMLVVRALDSVAQDIFIRKANQQVNLKGKQKEGEGDDENIRNIRQRVGIMTDKLDAIGFWVASSRIMWCFFYRPERLPSSYLKWIRALASVDGRLLEALRRRRNGTWTYGKQTAYTELMATLAEDLGYPPAWGRTTIVPPKGGKQANEVWKQLGVEGRNGIGGLPCELVHGGVGGNFIEGGVGGSCSANAAVRGAMGFIEGLAIYAPVHFIPILLTRPSKLLSPPFIIRSIIALLRSSLFLSFFISSIWSAICFVRTVAVARIFPMISHNFLDGPYGGIMAGCLACGASIWIEQGKRRGEMALYVLPRALRTLLKDQWLTSGSRSLKFAERSTFMLSLAWILAASKHHPETLRGLSRWTVMFVMNGAGSGTFKRKD